MKYALTELKAAWKRERTALAEFLVALAIVDKERLCLDEAYSSLSHFLQEGMGLSRSSALKRINACRLVVRFPQFLEKVREGRLHLSALMLIATHLRENNVDEISKLAEGKSETAIKYALAERFPQEMTRTRQCF